MTKSIDDMTLKEKRNFVENSKILHDDQSHVFSVDLGSGSEKALVEYEMGEKDGQPIRVYAHIGVPPVFRGTGLSKKLATYSFDYALQHGWKVKVACPWMSGVFLVGPTLAKYGRILV